MKVDYQQWVDAINKGTKWASDYFYCLACATRWEWTAQYSRILFYLLVLAPLFLSAIPITSSTIFILHTYARKPSSIICQTFWHISSPSSETIFNHYSFMWISLSLTLCRYVTQMNIADTCNSSHDDIKHRQWWVVKF